jgi:hypothetical protein
VGTDVYDRVGIQQKMQTIFPFEQIIEAIMVDNHNKIKKWRKSFKSSEKGNLADLDFMLCRSLDKIFQESFMKASKKEVLSVPP